MAGLPSSSDVLWRWAVTLGVAAVSSIGIASLHFSADPALLVVPLVLGTASYAVGLLLFWLGGKGTSFVVRAAADFFCTAGQLIVFLLFATGWQYLAAASGFPLCDQFFAAADAAIGFDWHAYHAWMTQAPKVSRVFHFAYGSVYLQIAALALVHSLRSGSDDNAEFLWCFMVSLLMVLLLSAPFPALGYPGEIGQYHIDVLLAARTGAVGQLAGIVTFPSFHTVLGILLIYYARHIKTLLWISVPLNVLLILATPPMGGHYLVDVLAGGVVAVCSILLVRKMRAAARLSPQAAPATR